MAIDKNKIAAPIAITDPYNLLGIYPSNGIWDVADIVTLERPLLQGGRPGRINKWSRHKPVRYPQAAPLSDNYPQQSGGVTTYVDQWEGSETDKNQGIRYGLKARYRTARISSLSMIPLSNMSPILTRGRILPPERFRRLRPQCGT